MSGGAGATRGPLPGPATTLPRGCRVHGPPLPGCASLPAPSGPACPRCHRADHVSLPSAEKQAGVFHLQAPSGPYGLNFSEAEAACRAQGAVLASLPQLSAAQKVCGAQGSGAKPVGAPPVGPEVSAPPPSPTAGLPPVPRGLAGQRLGSPPGRLPCGRLWRWPGGHRQPRRPGEPLGVLGCLLLPRARCSAPCPRTPLPTMPWLGRFLLIP